MGNLIEGLWDCASCGTNGIGGSKRVCPNCGKPRDASVKFYLPGEKKFVPEEESRKISRNPDWSCFYCDSLNSDHDKLCKSCGAERTEKNPNYFEAQRKPESESWHVTNSEDTEKTTDYFEAQVKSESEPWHVTDTEREKSSTKFSMEENARGATATFNNRNVRKFSWQPVLKWIMVLAFIFALVAVFVPRDKELLVTDVGWRRETRIEEYRTVTESDWSVPAGGRLQYTQWEFHHYQSVFDHTEVKTRQVPRTRLVGYNTSYSYRDLGNGYFEQVEHSTPVYETYMETETYSEDVYRDEPVYATKYYYEIERWLYARSVISEGMNQHPYWEEFTLGDLEREAGRSEDYWFYGVDKKEKELKVTLSKEEWDRLTVGKTVSVRVNSLGFGTLNESGGGTSF